jgi:hypothetical protein
MSGSCLEVVIEVSGGIAYCASKPDAVRVVIRDYDNEDPEQGSEYSEEIID